MKEFLILVGLIVLISCDTTQAYFEGLNQSPEIVLFTNKEDGKFVQDSVKVSGEVGQFFYDFGVGYGDANGNIDVITVDTSFNRPMLLVAYDTLLIDFQILHIRQDADSATMRVALIQEGTHDLNFRIKDQFGVSDAGTLRLEAFRNLPPVVQYYFEAYSNEHRELVSINLTGSYDQDARFGGKVMTYHFFLDGQEYHINSSTLNYAFPGSGSYRVSVYVTNNNGEQSGVESFVVEVE